MTYVDALNIALTADLSQEVKDKLTALRDAQVKRNQKSDKITPKQQAKLDADAVLAEQVKAVLANATEPMTVSAIKDADEAFAEVKVQKLSAIVRKLLLANEVKRDEVKRKAVFSLA
jgi:hypothetical protein